MNDIFKRRLIGLAVLLALVFILSLLLPKSGKAPGSDGLPSTTVALDGSTMTTKPLPVLTPAPEPTPAAPEPVEPATAGARPVPAPTPAPKPALPIAEPKRVEPKAATGLIPAPSPPKAVKPAPAAVPPAVKPSSPPAAVVPSPRQETARPPLANPAAPPPAVAVPVPATKPAAGTLWYVQMGSFADAGNAQTTVSLLQNIGYRGETAKIVNSSGATLYRVRLGPFPSEAVARQAFDKVSRQGYPQARVVSEDRSR